MRQQNRRMGRSRLSYVPKKPSKGKRHLHGIPAKQPSRVEKMKVFVASTAATLQPYRDKVIAALQEHGHTVSVASRLDHYKVRHRPQIAQTELFVAVCPPESGRLPPPPPQQDSSLPLIELEEAIKEKRPSKLGQSQPPLTTGFQTKHVKALFDREELAR